MLVNRAKNLTLQPFHQFTPRHQTPNTPTSVNMVNMLLCLSILSYFWISCCNAAVQGTLVSGVGDFFSLAVTIDENYVEITMVGESDKWFSFGFGSPLMDGTYAVIASGEDEINHYILAKDSIGDQSDHVASSDMVVTSDVRDDFYRTVKLVRPLSDDVYTFPSAPDTEMWVISATAFHGTPQTIPSYHDSKCAGMYTLHFLSILPTRSVYNMHYLFYGIAISQHRTAIHSGPDDVAGGGVARRGGGWLLHSRVR